MLLADAPEVELAAVETAPSVLSQGDFPGDPPLVIRDQPVFVVDPPWCDLAEFLGRGDCERVRFSMDVYEDYADVRVGLYDPNITFRFRVPFPQYRDEVTGVVRTGLAAIGVASDPERCLLIRCSVE